MWPRSRVHRAREAACLQGPPLPAEQVGASAAGPLRLVPQAATGALRRRQAGLSLSESSADAERVWTAKATSVLCFVAVLAIAAASIAVFRLTTRYHCTSWRCYLTKRFVEFLEPPPLYEWLPRPEKGAGLGAGEMRFPLPSFPLVWEILILRRLDHPNVIKLEGLLTSRMSCNLYLVFEYMEHDLAGLASFPGVKFTEPQVKCYMQQLLRGLEHCHSRQILHRDIKGSNLLIDNRGILKIADFGLASFFDPEQRHPLTSRVVTLWYRPPELLLGATNYGVAVDLWSTGCILAELYAGKPIMPGRTEVEQLHKIFKLCGSPSEDYWRKSKLPHATIFKPQHPYARRVTDTFKDFPTPALALVDVLLSIDPADRGTASSALQSEFFTTKPYACNPSSLPRYPPSKEFDAKRREEEARRQGIAGGNQHKFDPERRNRESRAVPAPDANAELVSSLQKRQAQANTKSRSEMFNPCKEDSASGFPIEPPRPTHIIESSEDSQRVYPARTFHSGPLVNQNHPSKDGQSKNGELRVPGVANPSNFPVVVSTRSNLRSDDSNGTLVTQAEVFAHGRRLSESINEHFSSSGKYDQVFHQKDERSSRVDGAIGYGSKGNKIHHSGPLNCCPSGTADEMLKENDRQIQEVFRRTRVEKSKARRAHGHAGDGHHQFGLRPSDFGAAPVYPSSRSSHRAVQQ